MAVARRTVPLAVDALDQLPESCRSCVRWELDPLAAARARRSGAAAEHKQQWWRDALTEGHGGGVLARLEGRTVGYATWSLPGARRRGRRHPDRPGLGRRGAADGAAGRTRAPWRRARPVAGPGGRPPVAARPGRRQRRTRRRGVRRPAGRRRRRAGRPAACCRPGSGWRAASRWCASTPRRRGCGSTPGGWSPGPTTCGPTSRRRGYGCAAPCGPTRPPPRCAGPDMTTAPPPRGRGRACGGAAQ